MWWCCHLSQTCPPHTAPFPPKELPLSQAAGQDGTRDWGGRSGDLERGNVPQTQQGCWCWKVKLREGNKEGGGQFKGPKRKGGKAGEEQNP